MCVALFRVALYIIQSEFALLASWYAMHVVTPEEKTIVANCLSGTIRPKAAATQLALTATSLQLEEHAMEVNETEDGANGQKKRRYKRSRTYDPQVLVELKFATRKYRSDDARMAVYSQHNINPEHAKKSNVVALGPNSTFSYASQLG